MALMAAEDAAPEPWTQLQGIAEVLEVMEAAVSQNIFLPQLMLYRWALAVLVLLLWCWLLVEMICSGG